MLSKWFNSRFSVVCSKILWQKTIILSNIFSYICGIYILILLYISIPYQGGLMLSMLRLITKGQCSRPTQLNQRLLNWYLWILHSYACRMKKTEQGLARLWMCPGFMVMKRIHEKPPIRKLYQINTSFRSAIFGVRIGKSYMKLLWLHGQVLNTVISVR
jgi:hypothetical protein